VDFSDCLIRAVQGSFARIAAHISRVNIQIANYKLVSIITCNLLLIG
jgi:hypothetical protein